MLKTKLLLIAALACPLFAGCANYQPGGAPPLGTPVRAAVAITPFPPASDAQQLPSVPNDRGQDLGGDPNAQGAPPQSGSSAAGSGPAPGAALPAVPPAAPRTVVVWVTAWNQYVVRSRDTLGAISMRLKIPVNTLMRQNGIADARRLRVGQVLRYAVQQRQYKTLPPAPAPPAAPAQTTTLSVQSYQVQPGDTLQVIADTLHTTLDDIVRLNGLRNPNLLFAGQFLQVPVVGPSAPPAAPADTTLGAKIIPDSEAVFSPAYADFDIDAFANRYGGYLVSYQYQLHRQAARDQPGGDPCGIESTAIRCARRVRSLREANKRARMAAVE